MGSVDDLERLAALHARGELTDSEFVIAKREVIARTGAGGAPEPGSAEVRAPSAVLVGRGRSRARRVLVVGMSAALLTAGIVLLVSGRSGTETDARAPGQSSLNPVTTSVESTTAASSTASATSELVARPCRTEYGVDGAVRAAPPATGGAALPAEISSRLGLYSNERLTVLAPQEWTCRGLVAADGGEYLSVYPPGEPDPAGNGASGGRGVVAERNWLGHIPGASLVCAYFPGSEAVQKMASVGGCPALTPGVVVTHPASGLAEFTTPDNAYGVVLYPQQAGDDVTLAKETCRLDPEDSAALCPFITEDFVARRPTDGP